MSWRDVVRIIVFGTFGTLVSLVPLSAAIALFHPGIPGSVLLGAIFGIGGANFGIWWGMREKRRPPR
jgi:hypothetical protein